ncbi:hypothetical protein LNP26_22640 [Klebsiella variicola subsp. variicola]|nr:hypothetical protein [Klebsiella variicola subsp. variicola]
MVRSHGDLYPPWYGVDHVIAAGSDPAVRGAGAVLSGAQKLGDEAENLPAGVSGPMMNDEFADVTFALFALKARGEPPRQLVRDAEALRQQLLHVPGVKK